MEPVATGDGQACEGLLVAALCSKHQLGIHVQTVRARQAARRLNLRQRSRSPASLALVYPAAVARYSFTIDIAAPPEVVFDLWTNLDRVHEWIRGLTGVEDRTGPVDVVGSSYTVRFGPVKSPTVVIEAERPRRFATRFGNWYLRGRNRATFEPIDRGTRLTQVFETEGLVPAITSWIWSRGSYTGSFRGELEHFGRLAEAEASQADR